MLLKGVHVLSFQFRDFATHAPDDLRRNEGELDALLAAGRVVPYIGASFALDETAAALRHVADGQAIGQSRHRRLRRLARTPLLACLYQSANLVLAERGSHARSR